MENKNVLLSIKDLVVKFNVRGRVLTAIRNISLDIYENESIAIVGESGSGKSVFTKTFAGMLDSNGFIDNGKIIFKDEELADTRISLDSKSWNTINKLHEKLNGYSKLEPGAEIYNKLQKLKQEKIEKTLLNAEELEAFDNRKADLEFNKTEEYNKSKTLVSKEEKKICEANIKNYEKQIADLEKEIKAAKKERKDFLKRNPDYLTKYNAEKKSLEDEYAKLTSGEISEEISNRNLSLAKEIYLSVGRYPYFKKKSLFKDLLNALKQAMQTGQNLYDEDVKNDVFANVAFRVRIVDEGKDYLHGTCNNDLARITYDKDWSLIRGRRIATVFQDPMTSLNPIITIGKQISSIIIKHQGCSEAEARRKTIELMNKVGIPNAENRYDDYPFQYSGGMRQRIVIAIALSCQPKILICDEPTTALDVTIQAQILKLIKDLQKEFGYTIVFITHDLGVVANIADRVAVLYGGQIVELGTVEDVFYEPAHPYTWALLSSLPQLAQRNTKLFSITGTPPSLYNKIVGDAFAPRNPYCLKIDTLVEPPMFKISDTHCAKTWLLDPRSPKISKPEIIENIHEKLIDSFNI